MRTSVVATASMAGRTLLPLISQRESKQEDWINPHSNPDAVEMR